MNSLTPAQHKTYRALCDEYIAGNFERITHLLGFINIKACKAADLKAGGSERDRQRHADLIAIYRYAETDF